MDSRLTQHTIRLAMVAGLAALAFVALAPNAGAQAIIDNGVVMLGVDLEGNLNVPANSRDPAVDPSLSGTYPVGIRYMGTNAEATAPGCLCEGWGLAYDNSVQGWANNAGWPPVSGMTSLSFTSTMEEATSVVQVGDIEVEHYFFPDERTDFAYRVRVTLTNVGSQDFTDVTYRRSMDWDVEPTPFTEYTTIQAKLPIAEVLSYSCTNGFASDAIVSSPLSGQCGGWGIGPRYGETIPDIIDAGPRDHGAAFDFNFGGLGVGDSRQFDIYYGVADTEENALKALDIIEAEVWSIGQPSSADGAELGVPNSFFFAFGGLNLQPPKVDFTYLFTETGTQLAPPAGNYYGPYNLTYDPVAFNDKVDLPENIDGLKVFRNWTFGDGTYDFVRYPLHMYQDGDNSVFGVPYKVCENITVSRFGYLKYAEACKVLGVHNRAPVPKFKAISVGENKVRFVPSGFDMDGTVVSWKWDLGDGTTSNQLNPGLKSYGVAGQYRVCLLITDDDGSTGQTCQFVLARAQPTAEDTDQDGVSDGVDNCPTVPNARQSDSDRDGEGDDCDGITDPSLLFGHVGDAGSGADYLGKDSVRSGDTDADGIADFQDNCVSKPNKDQVDMDTDGEGDACDGDVDGDGITQLALASNTILDNCVLVPNPDQVDTDADGFGDACDDITTVVGLAGTPPGDRSVGASRDNDLEGKSSDGGLASAFTSADGAGMVALGGLAAIAIVGVAFWAVRKWK